MTAKSNGPPNRSPIHILTFTDLIYAALAAYAIQLFDRSMEKDHWLSIAFIGAVTVWMFYDWYANHYFAIEEHLGSRNIPLDFISFWMYAPLLFYAADGSILTYVFLALRGARGIAYNVIALRRDDGPRDAERLRSYNYSSGFMVACYLVAFALDRKFHLIEGGCVLSLAVLIWLSAYGISAYAERRFRIRYDRRVGVVDARQRSVDIFGIAVVVVLVLWRYLSNIRRGGNG